MAQSTFVQDALPIVIVAVVLLAGVVAVVLAFAARGTYDRIGQSDITFDREAAESTNDADDARQLLDATNARRLAHGRPPLDLEDLGGGADEELRAEVRAFVQAASARRVARGQPPLDIEAEVELRLSGRDG